MQNATQGAKPAQPGAPAPNAPSGIRPGGPPPPAQQGQQQPPSKQNRVTTLPKPVGIDPLIILQERENRCVVYFNKNQVCTKYIEYDLFITLSNCLMYKNCL